MRLKPSEIRYSQDSIKADFSEDWHGTILDTFEQLVDGDLQVADLGLIQVGWHLGHYVCFEGNRRLFIFKKLESAGRLSTIQVQIITPNQWKIENKYTTNNGGTSIRVRRHPRIDSEMNQILNRFNQSTYTYRPATQPARPTRSYDYAYNDNASSRSTSSLRRYTMPSSPPPRQEKQEDDSWFGKCTIL